MLSTAQNKIIETITDPELSRLTAIWHDAANHEADIERRRLETVYGSPARKALELQLDNAEDATAAAYRNLKEYRNGN